MLHGKNAIRIIGAMALAVAATAFLVSGGSCGCSVAPAPSGSPYAASPTFATPTDIPGVTNFASFDTDLYRGIQPSRAGCEELKRRGIKTIISLRWGEHDTADLKGLGFNYIHISSSPMFVEKDKIGQFLKVSQMQELRPMFVHCQHGSDRTGLMVAAYRVGYQNWSPADAFAEMETFGFHGIYVNIKSFVLGMTRKDLQQYASEAQMPKIEHP
ncbi:MAG: hypothetical protein WC712_05350 [Candidatus Brocadiia bacterium]